MDGVTDYVLNERTVEPAYVRSWWGGNFEDKELY